MHVCNNIRSRRTIYMTRVTKVQEYMQEYVTNGIAFLEIAKQDNFSKRV